eukprot:s288_g44.t1
MNAYHAELIDHLTQPAPPGYSSVSLHQVLRADRQAFMLLSERLTTLKKDGTGKTPLEKELPSVLKHSSVSFHLLPLAKGQAPKTPAPAQPAKPGKNEPQRHEIENTATPESHSTAKSQRKRERKERQEAKRPPHRADPVTVECIYHAFDNDSFLVVYDPGSQSPQIYQQKVLPFGSVASVTSFLRLSLALWKVGTSLLKIAWSSYFDDFLSLCEEGLERHTDMVITFLFSTLGWRLSLEKLVDFDSVCKVLGVKLDLRSSRLGMATVSNTEERSAELVDDLGKSLEAGQVSRKEAERLRGRLQFASAQLFGLKLFKAILKEARVVIFTDSESVRGSFLKSWSQNTGSSDHLKAAFEIEEELQMQVWLERVPSQSNPADRLSREEVSSYQGVERSKCDIHALWNATVHSRG